MSDLYNKIHILCESRGIKDGTMCREAGVPRSTLQELKMERTQTLSLKNLQKIADFFNVSISELTGEQKEKAPLPQNGREADIQAIIDVLRNQNDEDYAFSMAAIGKILK